MTRLCCLLPVLLVGGPLWSATVDVPVYPVPAENAFDHYVRATEMFPKDRPWDDAAAQLDGLDPAKAELMVIDAGAALEEFRLGLPDECLMPGGGDFSTPFPYLGQFRSLGRLLMVESLVRMERGDTAEAFGSCLDALKLGRDTARGGPLIHKLVSIACETMALRRIRAMAPMAGDADVLHGVLARLGQVEARDIPIGETLAVEWDWTRRSLEAMKDAPEKQADLGKMLDKPDLQISDATLDEALVELEGFYADAIAKARTDYWRWAQQEEAPAPTNPLARQITPAVANVLERDVQRLADVRATELVVALELFFAKHGEYPETLAELTPETLPALPVDPFSGDSFCYERDGELTYALYSVGPNGVDDGGVSVDGAGEVLDIVFSAVE